MVYTVTFNPALDYCVKVENLKNGLTNRSTEEKITAGGKGLNVSVMLSELGVENIALGFVAGFTGDEIERLFNERGIKSDFIKLDSGLSRINVKIKADKETEINAEGPAVDKKSISLLMERLSAINAGDMLVLAGNKPKNSPNTLYGDIMAELSDKNVLVIVDAVGDLLINSLKHKPFLIKPNNHELSEIFGVEIETCEAAVMYAQELQKMGAKNVLVSMAEKGAVLVSEHNTVFKCPAPQGEVINSVGAGDSMVAGFITGYLQTGDYVHALKTGVASGSASAFSGKLASKKGVNDIYKELLL